MNQTLGTLGENDSRTYIFCKRRAASKVERLTTKRLAEYCSTLRYDDIPKAVRERAQDMVLDLIGVAIYGSTLASSNPILKYVESLGGRPEATVFGLPRKTTAAEAAMANGTSAHSPELDDTEHGGPIHVGTTVIPAALALGEKTHTDGANFVVAVVAGYDVAVRCAMAAQGSSRAHYRRGFHPTATCGAFAAAAASGRILGLSPEKMANAFGIAGSQASGLLAFLNDGSWTKRLGAGRASQSGVMAASLAELGFTGPTDVLEGKNGFLQAYTDEPDPSWLIRGLGEEFSVMNTGIKFHACCRYNQSAIDCAIELQRKYQFAPEDISEVRVGVVKTAVELLSEPHDLRYNPKTVVDAQFSIPYSVGVALVRGRAFIDDYTEQSIRDPQLLSVTRRIKVEHDPHLDKEYPQHWPAWVRLKLTDGRVLEASAKTCKGDAGTPLPREDLESKFEALASRVLTSQAMQALVKSLRQLEAVEDISTLLDGLEYKRGRPLEAIRVTADP